jgi:hypothetical protein
MHKQHHRQLVPPSKSVDNLAIIISPILFAVLTAVAALLTIRAKSFPMVVEALSPLVPVFVVLLCLYVLGVLLWLAVIALTRNAMAEFDRKAEEFETRYAEGDRPIEAMVAHSPGNAATISNS